VLGDDTKDAEAKRRRRHTAYFTYDKTSVKTAVEKSINNYFLIVSEHHLLRVIDMREPGPLCTRDVQNNQCDKGLVPQANER